MNSISELRRDIVSGEWVVVATGRAKRPNEFAKDKKRPLKQSQKTCPFEKLLPNPLAVYSKDSEWWVQVVTNKYPAFGQHYDTKHTCPRLQENGPYVWMDGTGFHEIIISRDHERNIAEMSDEETELIVRSVQDRYLAIKKDSCVEYISVIQNHGRGAGASIAHPHLQLIAIPVIPPDINSSLQGSDRYFKENRKCVHCVVIQYELQKKERVVYENKDFFIFFNNHMHVCMK